MLGNITPELYDAHGKLPAYTWPGGYPLLYLDEESNVLCPYCANSQDTELDPPVEAVAINYEDPFLFCDECSARIESAYAEEEAFCM